MLSYIINLALAAQALVFIFASHSALMACKLAQAQPHLLNEELSQIAEVIPSECYDFPDYIFSVSDYLIESNPKAAKMLVKTISDAGAGVHSFFNLLRLSGILLTYVENISFYFYLVYLPYVVVTKTISVAFWVLFYGALTLLILTLLAEKWQIEINVETIEDAIEDIVEDIEDIVEDIEDIYEDMVPAKTQTFITLGGQLFMAAFANIQRGGMALLSKLIQ